MDTVVQILVSGLTLGSMYALATLSLSLVWGSLNMLNMAQGTLLTIGAFASYAASANLGLPIYMGLPLAMLVGWLMGYLMYFGFVRFLVNSPHFETTVIIATIGLAIILENVVLKIWGAYPLRQPFVLPGDFFIGRINILYQNVLIATVSVAGMVFVAWFVARTNIGRSIRATAQNREAAQLMGVPVRRVFAQVLGLAGLLAAISGVFLSTITTLSPTMGHDPMVKAFIICAIAGLGSVTGSLYVAVTLGVLEASIQYLLGVRFAFPVLLLLVIVALIWRPDGVFGRRRIVKQ